MHANQVIVGIGGISLGFFLALAGIAPFIVGFCETPIPYVGTVRGTAALAMGIGWLGLAAALVLWSCSVLLPRWATALTVGAKVGLVFFGAGVLSTAMLEINRVYR
jgi:hypothetical protein